MAKKYIISHRRGTATQWANNMIVPLEGEIVIEIDKKNFLHKLKIGDGIHPYSELAYLMAGDEIVTQILAQTLPRVVTVTLDVAQWAEVTCETDPNLGYYGQVVSLDNITTHSRLDLQPDANMMAEFQKLDLAFVTENKGGVITVYSVGDTPLKSYTMQASIVETDVAAEDCKIVGTPISTPTSLIGYATTEYVDKKFSEMPSFKIEVEDDGIGNVSLILGGQTEIYDDGLGNITLI